MTRFWRMAATALAVGVAAAEGATQPPGGAQPAAEAPPQLFLAALSVGDLDRSIAFYRTHLGFTPIERTRFADHGMDIALLALGEFRLELVALDGSAPRRAPDPANDASLRGIAKIGFAVADLDATAARLRAAGVRIILVPSTLTGTVAGGLVRDPDGNLIGLYQRAR